MGRRRLLIWDASQMDVDEQALSVFWGSWGRLGGFHYRVPITDPDDLPAAVARAIPDGVVVDEWEFAGHGRSAAPLVNGRRVRAEVFRAALAGYVHDETVGWLRCCDAFQGEPGQAFAVDLVTRLGHPVAGHTRVVSQQRAGRTYGTGWLDRLRAQADLALAIAGGVLYQSGCYVAEPDKAPHWSAEDGGYSGRRQPNTALLTDRRPPPEAWAGGAP